LLDARSQRTLVFSAGTRNSFVVLPFTLALPPKLRPAVAVIVHQLLIKLSATMDLLVVGPQPTGAARGRIRQPLTAFGSAS